MVENAIATGSTRVEWGGRIEAHRNGATDNGCPSVWTPEHVQARMIEAMRTLHRLPGGMSEISALAGRSGWPGQLAEMAKAVDAQARKDMTEEELKRNCIASNDDIEADAIGRRSFSDRPSMDQVSRMEEALEWPMRFLSAYQLEADAITVFSYAKAHKGFDLRQFLRARMEYAKSIAQSLANDINHKSQHPDHVERRRKRFEIAKEITAEINAFEASVTDLAESDFTEARKDAIRRLRDRCIEAGCEPIPPLPPREAVPGICLARTTLDRVRKTAAARMAKALSDARIKVR